ncbi:MAG: GntR family transcriptional regulator [Ornithinimicrobium sp.]
MTEGEGAADFLDSSEPTGPTGPSGASPGSSLVDQVYESLVGGLLDGSLDSGDSISIDGTARHLGVSPTPVREALARLESTGNVVRVPRRGYWVAELPNVRQMADLMDARLVIEPFLAEMTCARATPALYRELEEAIEAMDRAPSGPEPAAIRDYHRADERFHRLIAEQAGNSALLRAYEALGGHGQRFRLFIGVGVQDARFAISEHRELLAALRRGVGPEVYRIMYEHIAGVKERALAEEARLEEPHAPRPGEPPTSAPPAAES